MCVSLRIDVAAKVRLPLGEPPGAAVCSVAEIRLAYSFDTRLLCSVTLQPRSRASIGALIRFTLTVLTGPSSPASTAACSIRVSCCAISPS